ncbi:hypothetical protein ACIRS3_29310 [Streptomyces virginiae]
MSKTHAAGPVLAGVSTPGASRPAIARHAQHPNGRTVVEIPSADF